MNDNTCVICYDNINKIKKLKCCKQNICEKCLYSILQFNESNNNLCPTCRNPFHISYKFIKKITLFNDIVSEIYSKIENIGLEWILYVINIISTIIYFIVYMMQIANINKFTMIEMLYCTFLIFSWFIRTTVYNHQIFMYYELENSMSINDLKLFKLISKTDKIINYLLLSICFAIESYPIFSRDVIFEYMFKKNIILTIVISIYSFYLNFIIKIEKTYNIDNIIE